MMASCLLGTTVPVLAEDNVVPSLETELASQLQQAQEHYQQVEQLSVELTELQNARTALQSQIQTQTTQLEQKKELLAQRLQALQVSDFVHNAVSQLLQSTSVTNFIQRFLSIQDLLHSDSDAIRDLKDTTDQLAQTQATLDDREEQLLVTQQNLTSQTEQFSARIASLKQLIQENKDALLTVKQEQVAAVQAQEAAVSTAATVAKPTDPATTRNTQVTDTTQQPTTASTTTASPQASVAEPPKAPTMPADPVSSVTTGKTLTVVATGYSYTQPGLSNYTATGIDLRTTSNVIAVDPSVIPLGSIVEIPGYGIAIAGDTGGDIKGNRIDLHYNSVDQALVFGRQQLTIRIVE